MSKITSKPVKPHASASEKYTKQFFDVYCKYLKDLEKWEAQQK